MFKWSSADQYLEFDNFGNTTVKQLPTSDYQGSDGRPTNLMYKGSGNIEFFIVGQKVYDDEGRFINDFSSVIGNSGAFDLQQGEIGIIPHPTDCKKYYIITTRVKSSSKGLNAQIYSFLLDMAQYANGSNGKFISYQELTPLSANSGLASSFSQFAITPKRDDGSYFLYTFEAPNHDKQEYDVVDKFVIDGNGITEDQNFSVGTWEPSCDDGYLPENFVTEGEIFEYSEEQNYGYSDYNEYMDIVFKMEKDSIDLHNLDSTDISQLETFASDTGSVVQSWSRNLLTISTSDHNYPEKLVYPVDTSSKRGKHDFISMQASIYPNPTEDHVHINWENEDAVNLSVTISTLEGKTKNKYIVNASDEDMTINIGDINSGIYIMKMQDDTGVSVTSKLVIL